MIDFIILYMAAALSAAIFAVYQIYLPALREVRSRAKTDPKVEEAGWLLVKYPFLGMCIFTVIAAVMFPILIPSLLMESRRKTFTAAFIKGILS